MVKDSKYTLVCLAPNNDITYCREEHDFEAKLVAYIDKHSVRKLNLVKVGNQRKEKLYENFQYAA